MGNVNAHHYGRRVRALTHESRRRLAAAGTLGRVVDVESHGSNPWTRYGVRFDDSDQTIPGLVPGVDFEWVRP